MSQPMVSILIPTYNRENLIEQTVHSALEQTYQNIEIIIIDNNSADHTWDILKRISSQDPRIRVFKNDTNIGPVRNWKRCLDEASGIYGKILWSDDLIDKDFIYKTVAFLEESPNVGFVYTCTEIFCENEKTKTTFSLGKTGIYPTEKYIYGVLFSGEYPVSPGCALFRMNDLRDNLVIDIPNHFNIDFSLHAIGNDVLIYLLTSIRYSYFGFIDEKLSFFRAHSDSITISSSKEKIVLNYSLAKAYFVENYRKDLIKKYNTRLFLHLLRFRKNSIGIKLIQDFYYYNNDNRFDYLFFIILIIKRFFN